MKNIIYLSFSKIPSQSANSVHVMKMCQAIGKAGRRITLIANLKIDKTYDVFKYYGVDEVFAIKSFPMPEIRILGRLIYLLFSTFYILWERGCLIYTRDFYSGFLLSKFGYSIIYECHEIPKNFFKKCLSKRILLNRNVMLTVCISEKMKNALIKMTEKIGQNKKILVAHDGVDIETFSSLPEQEEMRKKIGLPEEKYIIGYAGNLFKGRGIDIILEVASRFKEPLFVIVGGYKDDIKSIRKKMNERGIANMILIGHVPHALIQDYLSAFDLLLMPYQHKVTLKGGRGDSAGYMSPLKMFEYMASGKPIISSNLEVLQEVLRDKSNAILVQPDNAQEWVNAIILLKENERLAEKIGKQARIDVRKFTWDQRVKNIFENKLDSR